MRYLVTGKGTAEIDRSTIEEMGVPQLVLMEQAALAVADQVEAVMKEKGHGWILVVAEGGNNGGDGVAAARILALRGYIVYLWLLNGISKPTEAYLKQVELAEKADVIFEEYEESDMNGDEPNAPTVVVDAIFGAGLNRELRGVQLDAVKWINNVRMEVGNTVISVDIPTGISSETGEVLGEEAVRADITVTFGYEKLGMLFARSYCGRVEVCDIGFYPYHGVPMFETYEKKDMYRLPLRPWDANKGTFGNVLVIAGSEDICGAAYLSAAAAYRTGCGLVRILTHENNRTAIQQKLPEALIITYGKKEDMDGNTSEAVQAEDFRGAEAIRNASAIVIGPGLGQSETAHFLLEYTLRNASCPVVIDADGINILAEHQEYLTETKGERPVILTPHMLEMARLTERCRKPSKDAVAELKKNRITISQEKAKELGATLVLKDACTFVTEGEGGYFNTSGNSAMAKGGSGDVLTGVIAGLIAQGIRPAEAARMGVYIHGLAGDAAESRFGAYSVLAGDIVDSIPEVLAGSCR